MNIELRHTNPLLPWIVAVALCFSAGIAIAADLKLSGANEAPPVTTAASGTGTITVTDDGSVSGSVKVTGVTATMAHIHVGAAGKNGPVIVTLVQTTPGEWSVPAGTKLSTEQLKSYKAGELYVNVHSEANKGGEIRAQIIP